MKFTVTINFRKGPSFGCTVESPNELLAETAAVANARANGFDMIVRSIQCDEVEA